MLPRHRAQRTTLAWSYELLDERERAPLRRLSIFPGDFSLPDVKAVCGGGFLTGADLVDLPAQESGLAQVGTSPSRRGGSA